VDELALIMKESIMHQCLRCSTFFLVGIVGTSLLYVFLHLLKKKRCAIGTGWDKSQQAAYSFRVRCLKRSLASVWIAIGVLITAFLSWLIPAYRDLSLNQYVTVSGEALFGQIEYSDSFLSHSHIIIQTDAGAVRLSLPANWDDLDLPTEDQDGVIWYSKDSKILLSFESTEMRSNETTEKIATN